MSIDPIYIGAVNIDYNDETISIPFIDGSRYCIFDLKEDWSIEDFLNHNSFDKTNSCLYSVFEVSGQDEEEYIRIETYKLKDRKDEEYFLITSSSFTEEDFSMRINAVCLPPNYFSLLRFYREYVLPFSGKNFSLG